MTSQHDPDAAQPYLHVETFGSHPAGRVVLGVHGDIDRCTAPQLAAAVTETLTRPGIAAIDLDLAGVTFLDAAGTRCLLDCRQAADDAGVAMLLRAPGCVHRCGV